MTNSRRLIVVGGIAAGLSAASRARRLDPTLRVDVYERTGYCAYSACGLPYVIGGVIPDHESLVMRTPAEFADEGVNIHLGHEITDIDGDRGTASLRNTSSGQALTESFDELVLATGGKPIVPFAADAQGCFVVKTMEDGLRLRSFLAEKRPRSAVIIGGGYIGLEMAEALLRKRVRVTLLERLPHVLSLVDDAIAVEIERELDQLGVVVKTGCDVTGVEASSHGLVVTSQQGQFPCDVVVIGIGIEPQCELAHDAGIALGPHGGIVVDAEMHTSHAAIWAAGDCCETKHLLHEQSAYIPLGTTANKHGRVAGSNIGGAHEFFGGVVGTAVIKVCDLQIGRTGLSEREARDVGFEPVVTQITHASRARYYPDWTPMTVRMVADPRSGRLLGAQIAGREGVAKRIDVIATALHAGLTVDEVASLDLSYAPPFAPVWDPILVAARRTAELV